jgi:hypothetical protein
MQRTPLACIGWHPQRACGIGTCYYRALRSHGTGHHAALRQLSNRLVGILHGCLKTGTVYNEHAAWSHHPQTAT